MKFLKKFIILFFNTNRVRLKISNIKIVLNIGLKSLSILLGSTIEDSKNIIEIVGAKDVPPGFINQIEPKIPKIIGIKKYFINLFFIILEKK